MVADKRIAKLVAKECYDKMGEKILLLDIRRKCDYCNHVMLVTGRNRMHLDSLSAHIKDFLSEKDVSILGIDGKPDSGWILMDLGSLIIHLLLPDVREYYDLAGLWNNPKKVELDLPPDSED